MGTEGSNDEAQGGTASLAPLGYAGEGNPKGSEPGICNAIYGRLGQALGFFGNYPLTRRRSARMTISLAATVIRALEAEQVQGPRVVPGGTSHSSPVGCKPRAVHNPVCV